VGHPTAEIGVIGGSGLYQLFEGAEPVGLTTPWGAPSAPPAVGELGGRPVAFIPRHGPHHEHPPHRINYRANLWALSQLGVRQVLAPCASGSLQPHVHPGEVVICDQLVDRTWGRPDTFHDGGAAVHVSFADPYCPALRQALAEAAGRVGLVAHPSGTVVVVQGPRFSTRAESAWFRSQGWQVVNMTQYPEAVLARELGMCYAAAALVTDYDAGLEGDASVAPVTMDAAFEVLGSLAGSTRRLLAEAVATLGPQGDSGCSCRQLGGPGAG
jgi:5'-methylthioadenosine phosphorylase